MIGARSLAVLAVAALAAGGVRAADVPQLTGRVVDGAGILAGNRDRLTSMLAEYEGRTTAQIAVLTVPTLDGEPIESFSTRTFNAWGLGQKDKNNGVLVVVAPNDRKMRIEVGRGLEESLTSSGAQRIIDQVMAPAFRAGDFPGGVERGVQAIIGRLDGQVPAESPEPDGRAEPAGSILSRVLRAVGALAAGLLQLVTIPVLIVLALLRGRRHGSSSDSWSSSSGSSSDSSSWSSSSSSDSSSSFSGGGGSSGGGGASGSW